MNYSSTFCSLFLGLILISQSPLSANAREHGVHGKGELVNEVCNDQTVGDKIACHNILGSNPRAMKAKSYYQLSKAILTMAINKSVEAQNFMKGLAATTKSPALTECADFDYYLVVDSFKNALSTINGDGTETHYYASSVVDAKYPDSCKGKLASEHVVINPQIIALGREMLLLSQMASYATFRIE